MLKKSLSVFLVLAIIVLSAPLVIAQNPGLTVSVQQVESKIVVTVNISPVSGLEYCSISVCYNSDVMSIQSKPFGYSAPGWTYYGGIYAGGIENDEGAVVRHTALFDTPIDVPAQQAFAKFVFTLKSDKYTEADFTVNIESYEDSSITIPSGKGAEIYSGTTIIDISPMLYLTEFIAQMDATMEKEDGKVNITVYFPPVNELDAYGVKVYFDKTVVLFEEQENGYAAPGWFWPESICAGGVAPDGNGVMDAMLLSVPINTNEKKAVSEFIFDIIDTGAPSTTITVSILSYHDSNVEICDEYIIETFNLILNCDHSNAYLINFSAPTCSAQGYSGDLYCPDCNEIISIGEVLEKTEHSPSDWIIDKEPTSFEPGSKHIECTECGEIIETAEITAEGDIWEGVLWYEKNEDGTGIIITVCDEGASGDLIIPEEIVGLPVIEIGSAVFCCSSLTSITVPQSVTSIGDEAFSYCASLKAINVSIDNINYSSIDGVLFNKNATELIQCPGGKSGSYTIPDSAMNIQDWAFYDCDSLINVTIGNSVKNIEECAFYSCSSLKSIVIPDSVENIGFQSFFGCASLESVIIGNGLLSIGSTAFAHCYSLSDISIGNSVTKIGVGAFEFTEYILNDLNWQDSVLYIGKYLIEAYKDISGSYAIKDGTLCIADDAFSDCSSLISIIIPNSVTSIGSWAFWGCPSLKSIAIPDSVTNIGEYALGYSYDEDIHEVVITEGFLIKCREQSAGHQYAIDNNIVYEIILLRLDLDPDSDLKIDDSAHALIGVSAGATAADILSSFSCGKIEILKDGKKLKDSEPVGTGCVVGLVDGNEVIDTLTVVVQGDLDGDGAVNVSDARKALRAAVGLETINEFQTLAADVDGKAGLGVTDARTILRVAVELQSF